MNKTERATKESIAELLDGSEYPFSVPKEIAEQARASGLVIIYGASDDLMEFDGAFRDEISAYDGTTAYLDRHGVLDRAQIDDDDDEAITAYTLRKRIARPVKAKWCFHQYSWGYETEIPHAMFEIFEEGDPYCRGIVIDTADLPELKTEAA